MFNLFCQNIRPPSPSETYETLKVCVSAGVSVLVKHAVRHVKDSRRCCRFQRWACFITSHIETNLCPFTWRTASYSLTKLASRCGVRGPPQACTLTHTQSQIGKGRHPIMYFFFNTPLLSRTQAQTYICNRMSCRSRRLPQTLTHFCSHPSCLKRQRRWGNCSGCGRLCVHVWDADPSLPDCNMFSLTLSVFFMEDMWGV